MKDELYYCFSSNQKEWLDNNGMNFKFEGVHKITGNTFYAYRKGRVLDKIVDLSTKGSVNNVYENRRVWKVSR